MRSSFTQETFRCGVTEYYCLRGRLIHDRELTLFDGTRLLRHDKFDQLRDNEKLSDEDMAKR